MTSLPTTSLKLAGSLSAAGAAFVAVYYFEISPARTASGTAPDPAIYLSAGAAFLVLGATGFLIDRFFPRAPGWMKVGLALVLTGLALLILVVFLFFAAFDNGFTW